MPPTRSQEKSAKAKMSTEESASSQLTAAYLDSTLSKFFSAAEKKSAERFQLLESRLDTIQETLATHAKELDKQRAAVTAIQTRVEDNASALNKLQDKVTQLENKVVRFEDQSRRNNLRIMHLKEGEEKNNALSYLTAALPVWLPGLAGDPPELMRAHRIGPPRSSPSPPRAMIVQCLRFTDRDRILNEARKNKIQVSGRTIQFAPDFSDTTAKQRRPCYQVMHRARMTGLEAFLLYPATIKISNGSAQHFFDTPAAAEKYLAEYEASKTSA